MANTNKRIRAVEKVSIMSEKRCPTCNRRYSDTINFCLEDGTPLTTDYDAEETLVGNRPSITATRNSKIFLDITIQNADLFINNQVLCLPATLDDVELLIGEAERRSSDSRTITHFWDHLGIFCIEQIASFEISLIRISINKDPSHTLQVRKTFKGKLAVDGVDIKNRSTIAVINELKTGKAFEQQSNTSWFIKVGSTGVALATNEQQVVVALVYFKITDGSPLLK